MAASRHELQRPGEGSDAFPKSLPDDCVEYTIFILGANLTDLERREQLRQILTAGTKLTTELLKGFIWQRESFRLSLEREDGRSFLRGRTEYGDSVEDEWLIVYILRELSKQFPETWITITDTDGQFLLIEAANALPRWLNPEVADFRLWLHHGRLLIIPLKRPDGENPDAKPRPLGLNEALNFIEHETSKLLHLPAVEAEAFYRLQKYPKHVSDSLHHALLTIPRKLAYVLHENATYISAAVEAFYLRDPIALRSLQNSGYTEPHFPPTDLVTTSVKFTKVGYAQLKSQHFTPPALWVDCIFDTNEAKSQGRAEMGMKVACGFEMLMCDSQNQDKKVVREIQMLLEDIRTGQDELPTDAETKKWGRREDNEAWLDINFEDFENELGGRRKPGKKGSNEGFGDKGAQENLRKMVSRFGDFLNDDAAGADGAEILDDMDENDEEEAGNGDGDDTDDEDEDGEISFDEDAFANMMREMMGMPPTAGSTATVPEASLYENGRASKNSIAEEDEDEKGVNQAMQDIEKELREAGALNLNPNPKQEGEKSEFYRKSIQKGSSNAQAKAPTEAEDASEDEETKIDFNLAKNLLESFKSQGGASGPGGNMMNLMGMRLPRDEGDGVV